MIPFTLEAEVEVSFGSQDLAISLSSEMSTQLKTLKYETSSRTTQIYSQEQMKCKGWKFINRKCKILILFKIWFLLGLTQTFENIRTLIVFGSLN